MKRPYQIIEVANTHGGNKDYLIGLIKQFEEFSDGFGIKFQAFKYDRIAADDFSWFDTYKKLYFSPDDWKEIIDLAGKTKDIWLDMFDTYSTEILENNLENIYGIKLQASVLYNYEMLNALAEIDLSKITIQLNIAGYDQEEIQRILDRLNKDLKPKNFIIQFGFQNYPTELNDAGLSKIKTLKTAFPEYELCFADHIEGTSEEATIIPLVAAIMGCSYIEKHVMYDQMKTAYDMQSSLIYPDYKILIQRFDQYFSALDEGFINDREKDYLERTRQVPILKNDLKKGDLVSIERDIVFKRTDQKGLNVVELEEFQGKGYILKRDKKAGETIRKEDYKKSVNGTIVACRMKSSRLPQKALKKIGELTSIELCLKNVLKFKQVDYTVLATSTEEEDAVLKDYTYSDKVIFYQGDPLDVIERYLGIIEQLGIDVIMRVTGDCPYQSVDIQEFILKKHFEAGADYTAASEAPVGMNLEIYNVNALKKIKQYFPNAEYSEYMTYYIINNMDYFKINKVDLPEKFVRDYRMTLDYEEDLEMFNKVEQYFNENNIEYTVEALFSYLDKHPEIVNINKNCGLVYEDNTDLIEQLNKATTIVE